MLCMQLQKKYHVSSTCERHFLVVTTSMQEHLFPFPFMRLPKFKLRNRINNRGPQLVCNQSDWVINFPSPCLVSPRHIFGEVQVEQVWTCLGEFPVQWSLSWPSLGGAGSGPCTWRNPQTDIHDWKHYLTATSLVGGNYLIDANCKTHISKFTDVLQKGIEFTEPPSIFWTNGRSAFVTLSLQSL